MGEKKLAVNNKKKRILNISLAVIGIIVVGLLFNKILEQWSGFRAILDKISSAFAPIIVGAVIAFLMNPILVFSTDYFIRYSRRESYRIRKIVQGFENFVGYFNYHSVPWNHNRNSVAGGSSALRQYQAACGQHGYLLFQPSDDGGEYK